MVTGWLSIEMVPSTRPAIVSGSSAVMSPVTVMDGPICEADDMGAPLAPGNGKDCSVRLARNSPDRPKNSFQKTRLNHEFDDWEAMKCRGIDCRAAAFLTRPRRVFL